MGTRIPSEIQEQLHTMLSLNVTVPSLNHYVEYVVPPVMHYGTMTDEAQGS